MGSLSNADKVALSLELPDGYRIAAFGAGGGRWILYRGEIELGMLCIEWSCVENAYQVHVMFGGYTTCKPEDFMQTLAGMRVRGMI